jgi:branched-chain amino acid transport system permease protein
MISWRVVHSPFGPFARRHPAEPATHDRHAGVVATSVYTLSAAMAGSAGALSAHSTRFVGLSVLSLLTSGVVTVMLILGGTRRLYGAFLGATIYYLVQDSTAKLSPYFWEFIVGGMLMATVLFLEGGLMGGLVDFGRVGREPSRGCGVDTGTMTTAALQCAG